MNPILKVLKNFEELKSAFAGATCLHEAEGCLHAIVNLTTDDAGKARILSFLLEVGDITKVAEDDEAKLQLAKVAQILLYRKHLPYLNPFTSVLEKITREEKNQILEFFSHSVNHTYFCDHEREQRYVQTLLLRLRAMLFPDHGGQPATFLPRHTQPIRSAEDINREHEDNKAKLLKCLIHAQAFDAVKIWQNIKAIPSVWEEFQVAGCCRPYSLSAIPWWQTHELRIVPPEENLEKISNAAVNDLIKILSACRGFPNPKALTEFLIRLSIAALNFFTCGEFTTITVTVNPPPPAPTPEQ